MAMKQEPNEMRYYRALKGEVVADRKDISSRDYEPQNALRNGGEAYETVAFHQEINPLYPFHLLLPRRGWITQPCPPMLESPVDEWLVLHRDLGKLRASDTKTECVVKPLDDVPDSDKTIWAR